jgi:hypothetical protein
MYGLHAGSLERIQRSRARDADSCHERLQQSSSAERQVGLSVYVLYELQECL